MTESARQALVGLRDFTTLQWYVVPLLVLLFYIYVVEIREARRSANWDAVIAGVMLFSAEFVNESINGWIFAISGYSALWLAPGPTALRTLVGWNVEIMFMFAVSVLIELGLNKGGLLVWDFRWWNSGLPEVLPIFAFGYLWFYAAAKYAIERPTLKGKVMVPVTLFAVAVALNLIGLELMGWRY